MSVGRPTGMLPSFKALEGVTGVLKPGATQSMQGEAGAHEPPPFQTLVAAGVRSGAAAAEVFHQAAEIGRLSRSPCIRSTVARAAGCTSRS